jgi:FG-GAP repeat protein
MSGRHPLIVCTVALVSATVVSGAQGSARSFIQQGPKLVVSDEAVQGNSGYGNGKFGYSVALSADGSTALIGGFEDNGGLGAAWVFTRDGSTWKQQGPKLTGAGEIGPGWFGQSVALSADGNTALVGGSEDNVDVGAVWVFTRSGGSWKQDVKLTGSKPAPNVQDGFGISVALAADGNTALVGAYNYNGTHGAAFAFKRTGSTWTHLGKTLTGKGEKGFGYFGSSVALSGDGKTAIVGAPSNDEGIGAAWVFTLSTSSWKAGPKLTARGESGHAAFGCSSALSANGATALIGGCRDAQNAGAAWVFVRAGSSWKQQGSKLTAEDAKGKSVFGSSAALAADGNSAIIGGPADNGAAGAAWAYARTGSGWKRQGPKLTGGGARGPGSFGFAVALSKKGDIALLGGPNDGNSLGAAWVYASGG